MKIAPLFLRASVLAVFLLAGFFTAFAQTSTPVASPTVSILNPVNGEVFFTPTNITITATAISRDPSSGVITVYNDVTNVAFYAGSNFLGNVSAPPYVPPPPGSLVATPIFLPAFTITWTNAPVGDYALTAVATDTAGLVSTSAPVNITVQPGPPPPPPTNLPPVVRITSPPDNAIFRAPLNLPLFAFACVPSPAANAGASASVTNVEFFANTTNDLGPGQPVRIVVPLPVATPPIIVAGGGPEPVPPISVFLPTNYFTLIWTNAPPGAYALTAVAADTAGLSATSAPVNIVIRPAVPPPTNRPIIVNIVATDPVALSGSNCWLTPVPAATALTPSWSNWPPVSVRFATNCGPKNAVFTVRRFGDTNGDVTVAYGIGGTAGNGVDYAALPGVVTIPSGQRTALVEIVPIDNGQPTNKTVVLTLTPDTNTPPDYLVGLPRRAAALIVDSDRPYPLPVILPDKCFHLGATGPDGAWFHVEYSTNLVDWLPVCTNQVVGGAIDFVDPDAAGDLHRFYRALPENNPPTD